MSVLFNRAQLRDRIRRKLQIIPPIDNGSGPVGAQPSYSPNPTNFAINDAIQDALSDINTYCGTHLSQYTVTISAVASTTLGPYSLSLQTLTNASSANQSDPLGMVNDVQQALWNDGTNPSQLVRQLSRQAQDRNQSAYYAQGPAVPQWFWIEGYTLYLLPAPSADGSLLLLCGTGFVGLQDDTQTMDEWPIDFQIGIEEQAVVRLSRQMTMDAEAAQRLQNYAPSAIEYMRRIKAWKDGLSGNMQPYLVPATYRDTYGTRRMRR